MTTSRQQRGIRGRELQHGRYGGSPRGAAHRPRRQLDGHADRDVPEDRSRKAPGATTSTTSFPRPPARTRSRISGTSSTTTSGTRRGSRSKGRSPISTSYIPATTSIARMTAQPTTRTIRISTTSPGPPARMPARLPTCSSTTTAYTSIARIPTPPTTTTPRRATRSGFPRPSTSACADCSDSSTRSSITTSMRNSANVEGLADFMSMNFLEPDSQRFPGVVYLNSMDRTDYEEAVFGQIQFDITDTLELSLGARYLRRRRTRCMGSSDSAWASIRAGCRAPVTRSTATSPATRPVAPALSCPEGQAGPGTASGAALRRRIARTRPASTRTAMSPRATAFTAST